MRIIITGGHLSPALATIEALPKSTDILLIGRKYTFEGDKSPSFEYQTVQKFGIPFRSITAGRLQRTFTQYTVSSLLKVPMGFYQAFGIIKDFKPDVILSFGGYISLPVVLMGAILRAPIVIHEQTFSAGLANKIAAFFARKVCISWESSKKFFPKDKIVLTGNPVKKFRHPELVSGSSEYLNKMLKPASPASTRGVQRGEQVQHDTDVPLLYITGGSAGSHDINVLVEGCIEKLLEKCRVIHQTGDAIEFGDFKRLENFKKTLPDKLAKRYVLTKFVDPSDVLSILESSTLVVSRAGVNTVTELLYFGKPAFLIPLNSEQMENAHVLKQIGLGEVKRREDLSPEKLFQLICSMVSHIEKYEKHQKEAKKLMTENAAQKIVEVVESSIHQ